MDKLTSEPTARKDQTNSLEGESKKDNAKTGNQIEQINKQRPNIIYPVPKLKKRDLQLSDLDLAFSSETGTKTTVRRTKVVDPEVKRIEISIAKAPPACQSVLKVFTLDN